MCPSQTPHLGVQLMERRSKCYKTCTGQCAAESEVPWKERRPHGGARQATIRSCKKMMLTFDNRRTIEPGSSKVTLLGGFPRQRSGRRSLDHGALLPAVLGRKESACGVHCASGAGAGRRHFATQQQSTVRDVHRRSETTNARTGRWGSRNFPNVYSSCTTQPAADESIKASTSASIAARL